MNPYPIASDLSYEVLKRQRRDPQVVLTPANQACVIRESRLNPEEIFSRDEIVRREEIPVSRYRKHGTR